MKYNTISILVAEDSEINQLIIQSLFESIDIRPDIASNGLEALDKINNKSYDIILTDINMPHIDGPELAKKIRSFEPDHINFKKEVIAYSANISNKELLLSLGFTDFIEKPVTLDKLKSLLHRVLGDNNHV